MSRKPLELPREVLPVECPLPPPMMADFIRLIYPSREQSLHVVAVGDRVHGYLTHWYDGRSVPCRGPNLPCAPCAGGQQPRWGGYLNVVALPTLRRRILCITEGAYRHSKSLREHDGTLRGKGLKLERMGGGKNAPVRCLVGTPGIQVTLPSDWDQLAALCRIWGLLPSFFHSRTHPVDDGQAGDETPQPHKRKGKKEGRDGS